MNSFNVLDFGAVADGQTDSTAAFRAALERASACRGEVLVPPGDYCTGRLTMGKGVVMRGTAGWSFRSYGASTLHLNDETADCLIDMTGAFGGALSGVCLDGERLGENIHGVKIDWERYNGGSEEDTPAFDDCRIGHFSGDGVHLRHIWCFSIRHCMLCFNSGAGLYIDGWDAFILDNWFSANGNAGIMGGPCVASITATGNRVEWNRIAGFCLPAGDSYNITGNFFDRSGGEALRLGSPEGGCATVTVTGNIFRRSGKPVPTLTDPLDDCHVRMTRCDNVVMTGNAFRLGRDDNDQGVDSPRYGVVMEDNTHCIVRDNVMHRGQLEAPFVFRGRNSACIVEGNATD